MTARLKPFCPACQAIPAHGQCDLKACPLVPPAPGSSMTEQAGVTTPVTDRPLTAEEGWIEWHGGENPVPGEMVDVRFSDMTVIENEMSGAWQAPGGWGAGSGLAENDDIIAYRVSRPTANVETGASEGGVTSGAGERGESGRPAIRTQHPRRDAGSDGQAAKVLASTERPE